MVMSSFSMLVDKDYFLVALYPSAEHAAAPFSCFPCLGNLILITNDQCDI